MSDQPQTDVEPSDARVSRTTAPSTFRAQVAGIYGSASATCRGSDSLGAFGGAYLPNSFDGTSFDIASAYCTALLDLRGDSVALLTTQLPPETLARSCPELVL